MKHVILKNGREKSLYSRHPWIFSGAIQTLPEFTDGDLLAVCSAKGEHLGYGYFNRRSNIIGRMLSFGKTVDLAGLIKQAIALRKAVPTNSNAIRLVNAESDFCPGLIVDQYDNVLVMQISTLGMEKLKPEIVEILLQECSPVWIYESSTSPSRKEEGMNECKKTLFGNHVEDILIHENGIKFLVNPLKGQKTGFFQDLREMRLLVQKLANNRRVLNCFSYTGAFSCYALEGNAEHCLSVDISKEAIEQAKKHMQLNGYNETRHSERVADCFDFLRTDPLNFDLIILDPPAFAKRKSDVTSAVKGYQEINRSALSKMPKNSLLLTCSCSYHVDEELFCKMLFHASREAKRDIRILQRHRMAFDHPISIYHPESNYLKGYLCFVS